ncbi:hypothetical protein I6N90_04375 [Paenibacillus sp. GSMTC-2017]|nr:hypothetical protein [Paenibacillus sp. GSMTC-2017]
MSLFVILLFIGIPSGLLPYFSHRIRRGLSI